MPDELWTEVCHTVQEAVSKTIPKKEKCSKATWSSEESLQVAKKRREVKGKGEKIHPAECRVPEKRRDKKAFLKEQCKETEENNTTAKTGELVKKTGDSKGTFCVRKGTIKDRNVKGPKEAEEIK